MYKYKEAKGEKRKMLKIDMTSFAGSMVATIVMKTMKVTKIVKSNDARSPDVTGMQNTSNMYKYQKGKGEQYN
jgi:hypothetical protein